jgi:hypothetical protein
MWNALAEFFPMRSEPGGFSIRRYAGQAAARSAIEHRDIYGAFVISLGRVIAPGRVTVLEASAASPTVAQLLAAAGRIGQWLPAGASARENQTYVRKLLKQKQPEFAAILERVVRELSFARTQFTGRARYVADIKVPDFLGDHRLRQTVG